MLRMFLPRTLLPHVLLLLITAGCSAPESAQGPAATAPQQEPRAGMLTVRVKAERYDGSVIEIPVSGDAARAAWGETLTLPRYVIDQDTLGMADVLVWTKPPTDEEIQERQRRHEPVVHEIQLANGLYEPRVVLADAGDTIEYSNTTTLADNPNFSNFEPPEFCAALPAGRRREIELTSTFDAPAAVTSAVYPWLHATVFVRRDTFAELTNRQGDCNLPRPASGGMELRLYGHPLSMKIVSASPGVEVIAPGQVRVTSAAGNEIELTVALDRDAP